MVVISAEETIFSKYCKIISKNPVVVTNSGKICLCQNQALIEHYDHEVQSKLYRQINTSNACTYQTVNNLAGQENHPHSDSCGFVETSKPPTNALQKKYCQSSNFLFILCKEKALQSTQQIKFNKTSARTRQES